LQRLRHSQARELLDQSFVPNWVLKLACAQRRAIGGEKHCAVQAHFLLGLSAQCCMHFCLGPPSPDEAFSQGPICNTDCSDCSLSPFTPYRSPLLATRCYGLLFQQASAWVSYLRQRAYAATWPSTLKKFWKSF